MTRPKGNAPRRPECRRGAFRPTRHRGVRHHNAAGTRPRRLACEEGPRVRVRWAEGTEKPLHNLMATANPAPLNGPRERARVKLNVSARAVPFRSQPQRPLDRHVFAETVSNGDALYVTRVRLLACEADFPCLLLKVTQAHLRATAAGPHLLEFRRKARRHAACRSLRQCGRGVSIGPVF